MFGIVNYGAGNFRSVWNAVRHLGLDPMVVTDAATAAEATHLVLPGVGSFRHCMQRLSDMGLDRAIKDHIHAGRPYLGICVGLQVLATAGEEFGRTDGLGIIPGRCRRLDAAASAGLPLPHIGWNECAFTPSPLSTGLGERPCFYFVHSYHLEVEDPADRLASCGYGMTVTAAVRRDNCYGTQFHPEKSQRDGLALLRAFAEVA